jgi:hypothetical protein
MKMKRIPILLVLLFLLLASAGSLALASYTTFLKADATDAQRNACTGLVVLATLTGAAATGLSILVHDCWD